MLQSFLLSSYIELIIFRFRRNVSIDIREGMELAEKLGVLSEGRNWQLQARFICVLELS